MANKVKEITSYFRSALAAQVNKKIDFKQDKYFYFTFSELINGKIDADIFWDLAKEIKTKDERECINVIIAAKTIKTVFDSQERINSDFDDLTGVYYVPAILNKYGELKYDEKKLPWIPREFLQPMIEPILSMGNYENYDEYLSKSIGRIHKIKNWDDYILFVKDVYENVTKTKFEEDRLLDVEFDDNIYIIKDNTVNATRAVINLYDNIMNEYRESKLYENFISVDFKDVLPIIPNDIKEMNRHCGQMGGEYPLSPSQRECINHFAHMSDGEILAVNGPPGTGKTTLLQSIVANMYVERALKKEKPPLIVASSTNNQAVTNIIESFGKIDRMGYENLEERWIEGVESFAVYFPASDKEAKNKGYHYTDLRGKNFISDIESNENILKSKEKLLSNFNKFFGENVLSLDQCESKIYETLSQINSIRIDLLYLFNKFKSYGIIDKTVEEHLLLEKKKIEDLEDKISLNFLRVDAWRKQFNEIPFLYKLLGFLKYFRRKRETRNRMFIESQEIFLDEYMDLAEIEEKYSYIIKNFKIELSELRKIYKEIEEFKIQYDDKLSKLKELNIDIFKNEKKKSIINLDKINEIMDKSLRYIEFWLSVHYYECRWVNGEDKLTENQKGRTHANVLNKLYNRLSMVTPCYVMTFYQLPKNFLAFGENKNFYLYNYIDLLIVDEAGQVSPEIAACSFSLAKKAIVVGDIHQIEPVWSISTALDKALSIEKGVITNLQEYEKLSDLGLTSSNSSVMKLASNRCQYEKHGDRGLFLSEHRRCYNEIISYCNELVYKKKLEPMRGKGQDDKNYKLNNLQQMGYKQIESEYSSKRGGSRYNKKEAIEIVSWLNKNFEIIRSAYPEENVKNLLGIITPFKAQVSCIRNELRNAPEFIRKNVSIGTVHTFQGAERRIIIMSTVYGRNEDCYFIDVNKSMLNVAVSRAKDNFLVFGDITSFKDNEKSATGLLKKYIIENNI